MSKNDDPIRSAVVLGHLIAIGKNKGFLTYDDVNDLMPASIVSHDEIDEWLSALGREGIEIVDGTPPEDEADEDDED